MFYSMANLYNQRNECFCKYTSPRQHLYCFINVINIKITVMYSTRIHPRHIYAYTYTYIPLQAYTTLTAEQVENENVTSLHRWRHIYLKGVVSWLLCTEVKTMSIYFECCLFAMYMIVSLRLWFIDLLS